MDCATFHIKAVVWGGGCDVVSTPIPHSQPRPYSADRGGAPVPSFVLLSHRDSPLLERRQMLISLQIPCLLTSY